MKFAKNILYFLRILKFVNDNITINIYMYIIFIYFLFSKYKKIKKNNKKKENKDN